jgi:hypothetical protein
VRCRGVAVLGVENRTGRWTLGGGGGEEQEGKESGRRGKGRGAAAARLANPARARVTSGGAGKLPGGDRSGPCTPGHGHEHAGSCLLFVLVQSVRLTFFLWWGGALVLHYLTWLQGDLFWTATERGREWDSTVHWGHVHGS